MKEAGKILLILGSHAHVPSGASESEFEYVYVNKIRPFVSTLYRYSNIQAVLHYSGVLLYWVERTHPEFFMLIEDMVSRKQAEILGGGFYEPMFPIIPLQDRIGQVELLTTYLRRHFGKRPQGCWMPFMAWEQHLANAISASDMNYTFLSQKQFKQAGLTDAEIFSPCITEDQGRLLTIFPVSTSVEEDLAVKSFSHVFIELKKKFDESEGISAEGKIICVFPETVSSTPDEAPETIWNRFFEEISLSKNIVEIALPSKILRSTANFSVNSKKINKASFPNSSALNDDYSPRRFLIEYDEANGIYSKMMFTNMLINQLKGDKSRKLNAKEELWKAQDSCFFSPGRGYLRSELRKTAYSSLIRAERLTREKEKFIASLIQYDFDFDGIKEFLYQDQLINCYIQLKGAGIFELDYLPKEWNYLDCGSTPYGRRTSFADIIASPETKTGNLANYSLKKSRFCFNEQYTPEAQGKKGKSCFTLPAAGDAVPFGNIEIRKCFLLKKDTLTVSYTLKNSGKDTQNFLFIPEINFSFAGTGDEYVRFYTTEKSEGEPANLRFEPFIPGGGSGKDTAVDKKTVADNIKILDIKNEVQILLSSVKLFNVCLIPALKNNLYQATRILPGFNIFLQTGETWTNDFGIKFSH